MAISRDDVLAAVEKFLPRTINYAKSADLGEVSRDDVFKRVTQIILTSLLVDRDTIFYIVYISAQRLLESVNRVIATLEDLESTDLLKGVTDVAPTRIEDLTKLTNAKEDLLGLSGTLLSGQFGTSHFTDFTTDITGFLSDQVVPNVRSGNTVALSAAIRLAMENLKSQWAEVLERREAVFQIVQHYQDKDIKALVAADIITAIRQKIQELEAELPTLSTNDQAEMAQQILIDLAASQAALEIVANAQTPFGTQIAGVADDGFTEATYLVLEGRGKVEPIAPILRGSDGRIHMDTTLFSSTGQTFDDGLPTETTEILEDPSVVDFTTVVTSGQYLTFAETGQRHTITNVTTTQLTLDPETPHLAATPQKYLVTDHAPGRLFKTLANDLWDEFTDGETGSTIIFSSGGGQWVREDKASGTDGRNLKASGTAGVTYPNKTTGTVSLTIGFNTLSDPGETFITDGVVPGDQILILSGGNAGFWTVSYLTGQESLVITSTWAATVASNLYIIYDPNFDEFFDDASATFLTDGVVVGDKLWITTGAESGIRTIDDVISQTRLGFSPGFGSATTGDDWVLYDDPAIFRSDSATFQSDGVVAGDTIDVSGYGIRTIASVDSQTQVTLSSDFGSTIFEGATYVIYSSATITSLFRAIPFIDFEALPSSNPLFPGSYYVGKLIEVTEYYPDPVLVKRKAILRVVATDYEIKSLDPEQEFDPGDPDVEFLYIEGTETVNTGPLAWTLRITDESRDFFDTTNTPFLSYVAGDILVYKPGTVDERRVAIVEVVDATHVRLQGTVPQGETSVPYAIISKVRTGMQLVTAGVRYDILDVVSLHILLLQQTMSLASGKDMEFYIVKKGNTQNSYRVVDEVSAIAQGPAGFPSSFVGAEFEFMTGRPTKGKVVGVQDPDFDSVFEALAVNVNMRIGERDVRYRLRALVANTTDEFLTPQVSALSALADDLLTVWDLNGVFNIVSAAPDGPNSVLTTSQLLTARLQDQYFVVMREGSESHGRYILFDSKNTGLSLDATTDPLRLKVAEVLIDFGADVIPVTTGVAGDLSTDPDADGYSETFIDLAADFLTTGAQFGDRLSVVYAVDDIRTAYVLSVASATKLLIEPTLPVATGLTWSLDRNSVSNSLVGVDDLKTQMLGLQDVVDSYIVPRNETVHNILELLKKQHMDRALDLLYDGAFDEFIELSSEGSSYSSRARASIQSVGGSTTQSEAATENMKGQDPATGTSSSYNTYATSSSSTVQSEEVETIIALAKGVTDILADERARSMLQFNIEEARNLGIYELTGEIESGVVSDEDPTLPWIAKTGSVRTKVEARSKEVTDALQYMKDNPDLFEDVE